MPVKALAEPKSSEPLGQGLRISRVERDRVGAPHVDEVDVVPGRESAAPVEDDGLDGHGSDLSAQVDDAIDDVVHRHVDAVATGSIAHLHLPVGQSLANDHDRRHADELCVVELHTG